jgi:subtilisin family serine protease
VGVRVAVGDGGLDETHPALAGRIAGVYHPLEGPLSPGEDRSKGAVHGTHVAGLVAGQGVGVAPGASLYSLILFDPEYLGDLAAAQALLWAVDQGAKVVNLSFGGYAYSETLREAVNYALERGVVVAAAAGNQGTGLRFYPAAFPGVLAVGALDGEGRPASFSNRGPWVSLWAPGVRVYSAFPGGGFGLLSGTSMASPIVAGLAALLKERFPYAGAYALRRRLAAAPGPDAVAALTAPNPPRGACLRLSVEDPQGRPLPGQVALKGPEEHWAQLNALGETLFREIAPGEYRLEVWTAGGFYWAERLVLSYSCLLPYRVVVP